LREEAEHQRQNERGKVSTAAILVDCPHKEITKTRTKITVLMFKTLTRTHKTHNQKTKEHRKSSQKQKERQQGTQFQREKEGRGTKRWTSNSTIKRLKENHYHP
jgi:hypothetical protein